ncbi:MAG TPA: hypothetical protein VEF71_19365 [Streptosporangiaceae bacterium]|nr:hypothetical protein [Streptosporangiaceae bacterium]
MPDWDDTERERDEDAAWRDLVARFDAPLTAQEPIPWPAREDPSRQAPGSQEANEAEGERAGRAADGERAADLAADGDRGNRRADGWRMADSRRPADGLYGGLEGSGADGVLGAFDADEMPEAQDPDMIEAPRRIWGPGARRLPGRRVPARRTPDGEAAVLPSPADEDGEHFVPPAPPPLPRLDPLAKGAWAALFGGPGYLVVATAAGWSVPGLAAFCAVAAFVAGFAILVLRMNDPDPGGPGGPDDGDDGAVV